jgi:hypothetical protein
MSLPVPCVRRDRAPCRPPSVSPEKYAHRLDADWHSTNGMQSIGYRNVIMPMGNDHTKLSIRPSSAAFTHTLLAAVCLVLFALPVAAAINAYDLGARYDSTRNNVIFL